MRNTLTSFILLALASGALAQTTVQEWQAKAMEKYPGLGVKGSVLNKRFLDAHSNRRKESPAFFADPQWPMKLADELAAADAKPAPTVPTAPTEGTVNRPFIGMTEAEARAKYGEPVKQGNEAPADKVLTFEKNDIYLLTFIFRGRVGNVTYTRKDKRPFIREEAEVLIQNNSNGARWVFRSDVPQNQNWETADGTMLAINHSDFSGLVIATRDYLNAMKRASANSLKGL